MPPRNLKPPVDGSPAATDDFQSHPLPTPKVLMNREGWLTELARRVEPVFKGFEIGAYRVACSWPTKNALARKMRRVGECHGKLSSKAGVFEIFISPLLDEPLEVAGTVCHELTHVAAGIDAGHGGRFRRVCRHVGLTKGKPTQAMPGARLDDHLRKIIEVQGAYPHQAVTPVMKLVDKPLRSVTLRCEGCGCLVRISVEWLENAGPPACGCGGQMEVKVD